MLRTPVRRAYSKLFTKTYMRDLFLLIQKLLYFHFTHSIYQAFVTDLKIYHTRLTYHGLNW